MAEWMEYFKRQIRPLSTFLDRYRDRVQIVSVVVMVVVAAVVVARRKVDER